MTKFGKPKEPLLSDDLKNILLKTTGDNSLSADRYDLSDWSSIFYTKYTIMKHLTQDQDLLHSLHNAELGYADETLNGDLFRNVAIFDSLRLPNNKDKARNYVCFGVDEKSGSKGYITRRITFWVVAHEEDAQTEWGVSRKDLLAIIIRNKFDWSKLLGLTVELVSDEDLVTNDGYTYRALVYQARTQNHLSKR